MTRGVAKAIDRIYDIPISSKPPESGSYLNISMMGAGKVYNHKCDDGWFSVDLRSMDNKILLNIKEQIVTIVKNVAEEELSLIHI